MSIVLPNRENEYKYMVAIPNKRSTEDQPKHLAAKGRANIPEPDINETILAVDS